jgi:hypothetical protein
MDLNFNELQKYKTQILDLCQKYHASNVKVFGSVARNEAKSDSDVDLLIDFPPYTSALDFVALQRELSGLLHCKVDLIISDSIHPYLKDRILKEAIQL